MTKFIDIENPMQSTLQASVVQWGHHTTIEIQDVYGFSEVGFTHDNLVAMLELLNPEHRVVLQRRDGGDV